MAEINYTVPREQIALLQRVISEGSRNTSAGGYREVYMPSWTDTEPKEPASIMITSGERDTGQITLCVSFGGDELSPDEALKVKGIESYMINQGIALTKVVETPTE